MTSTEIEKCLTADRNAVLTTDGADGMSPNRRRSGLNTPESIRRPLWEIR